MKTFSRNLVLFALSGMPALAIEPPVDSAPIPPQQPVPAAPEAAVEKVVPMPEKKSERPYLGVILDPVSEILMGHLQLAEGEGVVIGDVVTGGPAEKAGVEPNDILVDVTGVPVGTRDEVRAVVDKFAIGDEIEIGLIHEGERKKVKLTLGEAPRMAPNMQMFGPGGAGAGLQIDGVLEDLPEKHADAIRQALEQNLRQFEQLNDGAAGAEVAGEMQKQLMKRMQRQMGGNMRLEFGVDAQSTVRLLDDEGSIEMKNSKGSKEARVFGKDGELLWEGPYDTDQDKAAVPEGIRERIESLDFDFDINGEGMQLRIQPGRFRPLDEIVPDDAEAEEPAVEEIPAGDE